MNAKQFAKQGNADYPPVPAKSPKSLSWKERSFPEQ